MGSSSEAVGSFEVCERDCRQHSTTPAHAGICLPCGWFGRQALCRVNALLSTRVWFSSQKPLSHVHSTPSVVGPLLQ